MKISDRLSLLRKKSGLSVAQLSSKFGIPVGSWRQYERGPSEPGSQALKNLLEGGVNIHWLLTGQGEMLLDGNHTREPSNGYTVSSRVIDYTLFNRVSEALRQDEWGVFDKSKYDLVYLSVLLYNRVVDCPEAERHLALEHAKLEIYCIIADNIVDNLQKTVEYVQDKVQPELLEQLTAEANRFRSYLGSNVGKFAGKILEPGTELEANFLQGLNLEFPSNSD